MRGLKYVSWLEPSGYGIAARRYLRGLLNAGVPLTWTPMVPGPGWGNQFHYEPYSGQSPGEPFLDVACNRSIDYDTVLLHLVPEYYPRWCELEAGRRIIGYTTWETDRLPAHWPGILNRLDRVWVPSTWNRTVFRDSGVTVPIDVVPHILDAAPSTPGAEADYWTQRIPADHFVFYSINVWSARKAPWLLCDAWRQAFAGAEPVTLVLKTSAYDHTSRYSRRGFPLQELARTRRSFRRHCGRQRTGPAIVLVADDRLPPSAIEALHRRGDCYVSLSRAEGWGLGAFDAVAAANPVVMTGYGGQTDFLNPADAYLVDYQLVATRDPANRDSYAPTQHWAEPDPEHAARLMRQVFEHREEARAKAQRLCDHARRHFNERTVTAAMLSVLGAADG